MATKKKRKSKADPNVWKWSKQRREAVKLLSQGRTRKDTARAIHMSRNTITEWFKHAEFRDAISEELAERQGSGSVRNVFATQMFADTVANMASKALKDLNDPDIRPSKRRRVFNEFLGFMREFREIRSQLRLDYGHATARVDTNVNHTGAIEHKHENTTFRALLDQYKDKITLKPGASDVESLVDAAVQLYQKTNLLDERAASLKDASAS